MAPDGTAYPVRTVPRFRRGRYRANLVCEGAGGAHSRIGHVDVQKEKGAGDARGGRARPGRRGRDCRLQQEGRERVHALAARASAGVGELEAMSESDAASLFAAPPRQRDGSHLQVDAPALVERKSRNPRLTIAAESGGRCTAPRRLR